MNIEFTEGQGGQDYLCRLIEQEIINIRDYTFEMSKPDPAMLEDIVELTKILEQLKVGR